MSESKLSADAEKNTDNPKPEKNHSDDFDVQFSLAWNAFDAKDIRLAFHHFQRAVELEPNNHAAWFSFGYCLLEYSDFKPLSSHSTKQCF